MNKQFFSEALPQYSGIWILIATWICPKFAWHVIDSRRFKNLVGCGGAGALFFAYVCTLFYSKKKWRAHCPLASATPEKGGWKYNKNAWIFTNFLCSQNDGACPRRDFQTNLFCILRILWSSNFKAKKEEECAWGPFCGWNIQIGAKFFLHLHMDFDFWNLYYFTQSF